ncbi:hypothetical protein HWV62_38502 [Athelia sp. TMB]|nr:hypothetical protein HWV62_38502 [Athelia sp. TMB]
MSAYVVDLRSQFPQSFASSSTSAREFQWRDRALALENELEELRAAREDDRTNQFASLDLARLRDPLAEPSPSSSLTSETSTSKKKRKKIVHPHSISPVDLQSVLRGIDTGRTIPPIEGQSSVLASFHALNNLATLFEDEWNPQVATLLCTATTCAIRNLARFMGNFGSGKYLSIELLRTTSTLVSYFITGILPILISGVGARRRSSSENPDITIAVDDILGRLTTLILVPLIHSYGSITRSLVSNVFLSKHAARSGDGMRSDVRSTVCCLLRKALSDLDHLSALATASLVPAIAGVRERLALEAVRELENMYPQGQSGGDVDPSLSSDATTPILPAQNLDSSGLLSDRIAAVARKDITWYMCSLLHWLYDPLSMSATAIHAAARHESNALRGAILTALSNLCQATSAGRSLYPEMKNACSFESGMLRERCHRPALIDEVSQGMMFAVSEEAWLYYFGNISEDLQA